MAREELRAANLALEERVAERTSELTRANEALESFSYSVAHDLRAPVAAVGGFSSALLERLRAGDLSRVEHMAERVVVNAQRMESMIQGLLALSRTARTLEQTAFPSDALLRSILVEMEIPAHVRVQLDIDMPVLLADKTLMRQVFWNLLANAVKFTSPREEGLIQVRFHQEEAQGVFVVKDNGVGFDAQNAVQLFKAFSRLHGADFAGTGVGLSIVKRIVERHGGYVGAKSQPGSGAEFFVALPLDRICR